MRLLIIGATVATLTAAVGAQDNTVKSETKIKADDAQVVSMTGCVRQDATTRNYMLVGTVAAAGDDLKTTTKVKTDVDKDDTEVKATTKTKAEDGAVATSGSTSSYVLVAKDGVNLSSQVGHQVQISAVVVEPGHGDADVTIKDKTTVDPDNGRDTTSSTKTKVELPRSPQGQYAVVSVKPLPGTCPAQ